MAVLRYSLSSEDERNNNYFVNYKHSHGDEPSDLNDILYQLNFLTLGSTTSPRVEASQRRSFVNPLAMSQPYEKVLLSVRCIDGLIKSCLSVSFYELVKRMSETQYSNATKLKTILDNLHGLLYVVATLFVAWLISKSRTKTWIKLEHMIWVPLANSILQLALQVYSERHEIDANVYMVVCCVVALSSSNLWIDNIAVELINSKSANRMSMYLYLKCSGVLSNVINVVFALTLTEHQMVYFVVPALIAIKSVCVVSFTILVNTINAKKEVSTKHCGTTDRGTDITDKPKINHALWIISLLGWALFYTQRGEYYYTYLFVTSKMNMTTKWWRVCHNLQYVGFAIALYVSGKMLERGLSPYKVLLITSGCNVLSRCVQVTAWYMLNLEAFIASVMISIVCPPAGEILKSNVLGSLVDSPYALALMSMTLYSSQAVFTWIYYHVDAAGISPFVITTCLMVSVLVLSSNRLIKNLTMKFNKKAESNYN